MVGFLRRQALDPELMPVLNMAPGASLYEPGTIGGVLRPGNNACEVGTGRLDDSRL